MLKRNWLKFEIEFIHYDDESVDSEECSFNFLYTWQDIPIDQCAYRMYSVRASNCCSVAYQTKDIAHWQNCTTCTSALLLI